MFELPDHISKISDSINECSKKNGLKLFIIEDLALYIFTGNTDFLSSNKLHYIISYDIKFDTNSLYKSLIKKIVINKEVENSKNRYHFVSSGFEIIIDILQNFDPNTDIRGKRFNFDMITYDIDSKEIKLPLHLNTSELLNIYDSSSWSFEDVLGFVMWSGKFPSVQINSKQLDKLKLMSLGTLKESLGTTWEEQIEKILLLRRSGCALKFIAFTFIDGTAWVFKVLIDYMISMGIGINDESNIDTVFNDKKYELVDLYNEFFLSTKTQETTEEKTHRLTTTMKLLFDSPNLNIPRPYVSQVRSMAGGILGRCCLGSDIGGSIAFFGCGENMTEEECNSYPVSCTDNNPCLREHQSFLHIPDENWDLISVDFREWCPSQVCPDANNIHCLQP